MSKTPSYWNKAKKYLSKKDKIMSSLIKKYKSPSETVLTSRKDVFFSLCKSIIGQQISVAAANSVFLKFKKKCKNKINAKTVNKLSSSQLKSCGLSRQKVKGIKSLAKKVFQENNLLIDRLKYKQRGGVAPSVENYFLSFTGDTQATARADLVRTDFTPNDPTNKGFAEGSGRIPLAKSGFTISYWYRPDEHTSDAFAMGWKRESNARFSFGMRNAARPFFGLGSNEFGTYGSHNSWVTMTQNSGFIDNYNIDDYLDGDSNLKLNKWYHIVVTYVGQEPGGVANNETEQIRRIYLDGYQIYGQKDEAIGTDYNDWHNVDRTGLILSLIHI